MDTRPKETAPFQIARIATSFQLRGLVKPESHRFDPGASESWAIYGGWVGGPPSPMLASPGELPSGPGWAFEFKWDGVRAIAVVTGGKTRLFARSGAEITAAYPELAGVGAGLDDTVLDGEVVVLDA